MTEKPWDEEFERELRSGDILGASDVLRKVGGDGWVKRAEFERAVRVIEKVAPAPIVRREWSATLLSHPRRVDKELAATLLAPLARSHPRDVQRAFERLAEDHDPGVRAAAARLAGTLVTEASAELQSIGARDDVLRDLREIANDTNPIVRQVARSALQSIEAKHPDLATTTGS